MASNAVNNPVRDADGGMCVAADDAQALTGAMNLVMQSSPEERIRWGENAARHVAENYDYGVLGDHLDSWLRTHVK
jgi:glycosyltransferase involved in cell wall biosynthesis